jgi:hypothetical protein
MTTARRSLATALLRARSRAASSPPSYTTQRGTTEQMLIRRRPPSEVLISFMDFGRLRTTLVITPEKLNLVTQYCEIKNGLHVLRTCLPSGRG